jgi:hypothetical protein
MQAIVSLLLLQVYLASWSVVAVCLFCLPFVAGWCLVLFPQVKILRRFAWWILSSAVVAPCSPVCFAPWSWMLVLVLCLRCYGSCFPWLLHCSVVCVAYGSCYPWLLLTAVLGVAAIWSLVCNALSFLKMAGCHPWLLSFYASVYWSVPMATNSHVGCSVGLLLLCCYICNRGAWWSMFWWHLCHLCWVNVVC